MRPGSAAARGVHARALRALLAAGLGAATALLVSCSSSGGLIPTGNAGPLQSDFHAVANAAERGNGSCSETEAAISKTELDFAALPSSVDAQLRSALRQGIDNLKHRALALCTQPLAAATNTAPTTTQTTTTTPSTTPTTTTTNTSTTPPTTTTNATPGGGTPAEEPKEQKGPEPGGEEPKAGGGGQEPGQ